MPSAFTEATPAYFLSALVWGLLLVLAFAGWGGAVARLLAPRGTIDRGLMAALGLALTVFVGGVLNLFSLISPVGVLLWVAGGAGWFGVESLRGRKKERTAQPYVGAGLRPGPAAIVLWVLVVVLSALFYAGSVNGRVWDGTAYRDFDPHDDEQAYLAFPVKMLRLGGLGADPFDARRLNVLGGQTLLHTFVAVLFPPRTTHLLDAGCGLLLSLWLLRGRTRRAGLPPAWGAVPLLVLLLLPSGAARGNTTALFTGLALLVAAYRLVEEEPFGAPGRFLSAVPLGLVLAGATALKTTFLPAVVLFLAFDALLSLAAGKGAGRLRGAVEAGLAGVVFLSPWMLSLKSSSGTYLFPLLGQGFQGAIPWEKIPGIPREALAPVADRLGLAARSLLPAAPLALLSIFAFLPRRRTAPVAFGLAASALPLVLRFAGDPHLDRSLWRYGFPVLAAALAVLVGECLPPAGRRAGPVTLGALAVAAFFVGRERALVAGGFREAARDVTSAVSGRPLTDPALSAGYSSLLSSVPAGARVLTRLRYTYLLDPARHRLLLFSMPGMSSPPPGLPFFGGPEAVARYLGGEGIRYVAYGDRGDGSTLLQLVEDDIRYRYPLSRSRWAILAFHRDFHANVRELSFTRERLADRPDALVLDLLRRALRLPLTEAPERLTGFSPDGRTAGPATVRLDYERGEGDRYLRVQLAEGSGPAGLRVSLDGSPLPVRRVEADALVLDLAGAGKRLGTLSLDGPPAEILGVATVSTPEEAPRIGPPPQRVAGALEIPEAAWRSGFYGDDWTDGDGLLANLLWEPRPGESVLAVELGAGPPGPPESAGVRVLVNGLELTRIGVRDGVWRFELPPDLMPVRRIRILSRTFVPKEEGASDDARRLGVAVACVRLLPP